MKGRTKKFLAYTGALIGALTASNALAQNANQDTVKIKSKSDFLLQRLQGKTQAEPEKKNPPVVPPKAVVPDTAETPLHLESHTQIDDYAAMKPGTKIEFDFGNGGRGVYEIQGRQNWVPGRKTWLKYVSGAKPKTNIFLDTRVDEIQFGTGRGYSTLPNASLIGEFREAAEVPVASETIPADTSASDTLTAAALGELPLMDETAHDSLQAHYTALDTLSAKTTEHKNKNVRGLAGRYKGFLQKAAAYLGLAKTAIDQGNATRESYIAAADTLSPDAKSALLRQVEADINAKNIIVRDNANNAEAFMDSARTVAGDIAAAAGGEEQPASPRRTAQTDTSSYNFWTNTSFGGEVAFQTGQRNAGFEGREKSRLYGFLAGLFAKVNLGKNWETGVSYSMSGSNGDVVHEARNEMLSSNVGTQARKQTRFGGYVQKLFPGVFGENGYIGGRVRLLADKIHTQRRVPLLGGTVMSETEADMNTIDIQGGPRAKIPTHIGNIYADVDVGYSSPMGSSTSVTKGGVKVQPSIAVEPMNNLQIMVDYATQPSMKGPDGTVKHNLLNATGSYTFDVRGMTITPFIQYTHENVSYGGEDPLNVNAVRLGTSIAKK
ncbi:MAG: hypothetical protein JW716_03465 [Candidatus Aenigmarchaeota archaeon]|nr:hypothetical protein [Candidatus Aenigmarchaeota archaeon]